MAHPSLTKPTLTEPLKWAIFRALEKLSDLRGNAVMETENYLPPSSGQRALWIFVSTIWELNAINPFLRTLHERLELLKLVLITDHEHYRAPCLAQYPDATVFVTGGHSHDARRLARHLPPAMLVVAEIPCLPSDAPCRFSYIFMRSAKQHHASICLVNGWLYNYSPPCRMDAIENRLFRRDFACLIGIATCPEHPIETRVLIIVGGPQYRAGSHRQFTLLARQLADRGIASFRFDYRGMGDSDGDFRNFEVVNADFQAAIDNFMTQVPEIKQVVLWGLCGAASAALYYGHTAPRVGSMILLNPWVHGEAGAARARLKHYYFARLMQKSFWTKLLSGKLMINASLGDITHSARLINTTINDSVATPPRDPRHGSHDYIDRMLRSLNQFRGRVQIILSGNDLTAQEFIELTKHERLWKNACKAPHITQVILPIANHTCSSQVLHGQVGELTINLLWQRNSKAIDKICCGAGQ